MKTVFNKSAYFSIMCGFFAAKYSFAAGVLGGYLGGSVAHEITETVTSHIFDQSQGFSFQAFDQINLYSDLAAVGVGVPVFAGAAAHIFTKTQKPIVNALDLNQKKFNDGAIVGAGFLMIGFLEALKPNDYYETVRKNNRNMYVEYNNGTVKKMALTPS